MTPSELWRLGNLPTSWPTLGRLFPASYSSVRMCLYSRVYTRRQARLPWSFVVARCVAPREVRHYRSSFRCIVAGFSLTLVWQKAIHTHHCWFLRIPIMHSFLWFLNATLYKMSFGGFLAWTDALIISGWLLVKHDLCTFIFHIRNLSNEFLSRFLFWIYQSDGRVFLQIVGTKIINRRRSITAVEIIVWYA